MFLEGAGAKKSKSCVTLFINGPTLIENIRKIMVTNVTVTLYVWGAKSNGYKCKLPI